jgi:hypothetical protein
MIAENIVNADNAVNAENADNAVGPKGLAITPSR